MSTQHNKVPLGSRKTLRQKYEKEEAGESFVSRKTGFLRRVIAVLLELC